MSRIDSNSARISQYWYAARAENRSPHKDLHERTRSLLGRLAELLLATRRMLCDIRSA